jgi:Protein of unknown function (DUF3775)
MTPKARLSKETSIDELPVLSISSDKICFVISRARRIDVKVAVTEPDPGSNASDDGMIAILEDHPDDAVVEELTTFIAGLNNDEQIDLVALAWLGRDDNTIADWAELRGEAASAHSTRATHTARYLLGIPLVGDFLDEALSLFGQSCEAFDNT